MSFNYSRYDKRVITRNGRPEYINQLSSRGLKYIDHFTTAKYKYPSRELLGRLQIDKEYWGVGVRFYKLAYKYYGDASLWWIIPWFNKMPLESDYNPGDLIMIPRPLETVLSFFK
jgi:hypothetical protein